MSQFQPYIMPAIAAAGVIFLTQKFFSVSHNRHSVLDKYNHVKENINVPETFTNYFKTSRGLILHISRYVVPAAQCRGIVFFCHGFTEHSLRYEGLAYDLNKMGYTVCLIDHAGHGASQGDRSFCVNFVDYIEDVSEWMNLEYQNMSTGKAAWGVPGFGLDKDQLKKMGENVFIMGHSMGGLVAARFGMWLTQQTQDGKPNPLPWVTTPPRFILSAPGLALDKKLTDIPLLLSISQILSTYFPKLIVQTMPDVDLVSGDSNVTTFARNDYMMNGPQVYSRFGAEFINNIQFCQDNAAELFKYPILIMQSDDDDD